MHRIRRQRESLRLNANSSSTDLALITGDGRWVHRTPEYLHQWLDDNPSTQHEVSIRRGILRADNTSPKLFTAALESIFRRLTWETRGLKIDGEYLSHPRFADDILICANYTV